MAVTRVISETLAKSINAAVVQQSVLISPGGLDSALNRPGNKAFYEPDLHVGQYAGTLAYGIIKAHPFFDGNKRTAFWCANEFLRAKGEKPFVDQFTNDLPNTPVLTALAEAHKSVAKGEMQLEDLCDFYENLVRGRH